MGKKDDLTTKSPALAFYNNIEESQEKKTKPQAPRQPRRKAPATAGTTTRGYTEKRATKSVQRHLILTPELDEKLKTMKAETGQSINDFICRVLEDVLEDY